MKTLLKLFLLIHHGSCSTCNGLGTIAEIEFDKIIPDKSKTIKSGSILALSEIKDKWIISVVDGILKSMV